MSLILFIIGIIVLAIGVLLWIFDDEKVSGIVATVIGAVIIIGCCISIVPTGHTGVVTKFGKVSETTLNSGLNFTAPWAKVVKMDNRTQKANMNMSCFSSDIQEVKVSYTLNYRIQKENAQTIYKTIGKKYYNTVITPCIQEALKVVTAQYTAEELIGSRTELAINTEKELAKRLKKYNVEVVDTSIENMDFSDAFENAVEEKQVAQQKKLKAETEAARKIIEAEASAKEKIIKAEAEAKANATISKSLTDDVLQQRWIEKWDGKLPQVAGADAKIVIDNLTK